VPLHVVGHIDLHDVLFAAEHEFGELLREVRLARTGRAHEEEDADRPARVLQAGRARRTARDTNVTLAPAR
jgi:hypothetical protein